MNLLKAGVNATDRVENIPDVAVSGSGGLLSSPTARDEDAAHYKEKVSHGSPTIERNGILISDAYLLWMMISELC